MKGFLLSSISSGGGKTTCSLILLSLLKERGSVQAFKSGPDYIDPMFHRSLDGVTSYNLDTFFLEDEALKNLFSSKLSSDFALIEGAMGYYDGQSITSDKGSAYYLSRLLKLPTVLVVNPKGMGRSLIALVEGFKRFKEDSNIVGVILSPCKESHYNYLKEGFDLPLIGYLPELDLEMPSRHLGLVQASELKNLPEEIERAKEIARETIDLDRLISLMKEIEAKPVETVQKEEKVRIGVARDEAFSFYYPESLEELEKEGAEIIPFSPLQDDHLPDVSALYFGGGYPELHAKALSSNTSFIEDVRRACSSGMPIFAECGGYLYLSKELYSSEGESYPMVGLHGGIAKPSSSLFPFGYVTVEASEDNILMKRGEMVKGHEFHYWKIEETEGDLVLHKEGKKSREVGVARDNLFMSFIHVSFLSNPAIAKNFVSSALTYLEKNRV
ncbi:cobyrinate a,c-diamide synthase [Guggenheimella bovis]